MFFFCSFFCLIYFFVNNINFSEPSHKTVAKKNYQHYEVKDILTPSIYNNTQNKTDSIVKTQHNNNKDKKYKTSNIEDIIKNKGIPDRLKTHNIINNQPNNINICHKIPLIDSEYFNEFSDIFLPHNSKKSYNNMYSQRYNEYPPMNGVGYYNNNVNGNKDLSNMYNRNVSDFNLQQQNVHGENELSFTNGNTYGCFDQSNFTGKNTFVCGGNQNNPNYMPRENINYGYPPYNQPMNPNNNMGMNYPMSYIPQKKNNQNLNLPYNHQMNCNNNNFALAPVSPQKNRDCSNGRVHKKEIRRKNASKVKRGNIDINIETATSGGQGLTLDVNIDLRN